MDELKLSEILGNALGTGTAVAAVLLILWRIISSIAERSIKSLDDVKQGLAEHTKVDLAHHAEVKQAIIANHAEVREAIVRVEAKQDAAFDWRDRSTPVESFPAVNEDGRPRHIDPDSERRRSIRQNQTPTRPGMHGYRVPKPGSHHDE